MEPLRLLLYPLARRLVRRTLEGRSRQPGSPELGRFNRANVDALVEATWQGYRMRASELPGQQNLGDAARIQLACLALSFMHALVATGVRRDHAIELTADVGWNVYQRWDRVAGVLRSLLGPALALAARPADLFPALFPLSPPSSEGHWVQTPGATGFDMVRCSVAAYLRSAGAADLCERTWCNLDHGIAEGLGLQLTRTRTLAAGDDRCDLRLVPIRPRPAKA
jgi:hypothetical protein